MTTREEIIRPLVARISEIIDKPESEVPLDAPMKDDLRLDSLDIVDLAGIAEEELGICPDLDDLDPNMTITEFADEIIKADTTAMA